MIKEGSKVTFGGWYQRTTLHLTEVYGFLFKGESRVELSKSKLKIYRSRLNLKSVSREVGNLEYVRAITKNGIEIRYYEDGLYILEIDSDDIDKASELLKNYYEDNLMPALEYLFSLGAPTPKILSNIKDTHPIVVSKISRNHRVIKIPLKYGKIYSKITSKDVTVYKTEKYIFIVSNPNKELLLSSLVETQIFFREFKDQLHKYLNIHRKIWEEITEIKEKKMIKGKDVDFYRSKLESYKKTIDLIGNRINQMPTYAHTRASLSKKLNVEQTLIDLYNYRFEDLFNTLSYIKEVWSMTINYVNSAISILVEVGNKFSMSGIRSIQILASVGVITGIINYLKTDAIPKLSMVGATYLIVLGVIALLIDGVFKMISKNKKYKLKFVERSKDI